MSDLNTKGQTYDYEEDLGQMAEKLLTFIHNELDMQSIGVFDVLCTGLEKALLELPEGALNLSIGGISAKIRLGTVVRLYNGIIKRGLTL